jgi:hypothetical protein
MCKMLPTLFVAAIISVSAAASADTLVYRPAMDDAQLVQVQHGLRGEVERARNDVSRTRHRLRDDERRHAPHRVLEKDRRELQAAEKRLREAENRYRAYAR